MEIGKHLHGGRHQVFEKTKTEKAQSDMEKHAQAFGQDQTKEIDREIKRKCYTFLKSKQSWQQYVIEVLKAASPEGRATGRTKYTISLRREVCLLSSCLSSEKSVFLWCELLARYLTAIAGFTLKSKRQYYVIVLGQLTMSGLEVELRSYLSEQKEIVFL